MKLKINVREAATILSALRYWQDYFPRGTEHNVQAAQALLDMSRLAGATEALTPQEIDELCERINGE